MIAGLCTVRFAWSPPSKILPTAILSGLLALTGAVHANLIVNGSFENGTQTPVICNAERECAWVELRATDTPQTLTGCTGARSSTTSAWWPTARFRRPRR